MTQYNSPKLDDHGVDDAKMQSLLVRAYEIAEVKGYTMHPLARRAILDEIAKIEGSGRSIEDFQSEFKAIGRDVRDLDFNWSVYMERLCSP